MSEFTVVFDLSPGSRGAYYVTGDVVRHQGKVCVVANTVRLDGKRFRATLRVVLHPTPQQRRSADEWQRTMGGG